MKILTFSMCLIACLSAQAQNTQQLDSLISANYNDIAPGCVVLVAKDGNVVYRKAFGLSNLKDKSAMPLNAVFRLGSMSKQYTAIAVLQMVEQGKIRLQDSIQVYIKDFPHKAWPVTIDNLLSQSSGIINFQDIKDPDPKKIKDMYTPAQGVDYFKNEPLQFKPGSRFEYSNSNFFLLGYIIELVSGESYGQYIEQHLLQPANLQHTYYLWPNKAIPNIVSGYSRFGNKHWERAELQNVTMLYAAGGLAADIDDVWHWHLALIENKLISQAMLSRAWTASPVTNNSAQYGYGWFIKDMDGIKTVEHSGSTDGYQTDEVYIPQKDVFVAALFNGFETNMGWQVLTNDITRLAIGIGLRKTVALADDSLKRFAGTYQYNQQHQIVVTFKDHRLFVEATNPKDRLPKVQLIAKSSALFYIREASLQFNFIVESGKDSFKVLTFIVPGKVEEWFRVK